MGQHPDLRKGGQALLSCLYPQSELWPMVSPEMLPLTVCNNSLTLSTTWPPVSDSRQSVHQGLRGFTSLLELKAAREQSQNCLTQRPPSSHRLTADWLLAPSGTLSTSQHPSSERHSEPTSLGLAKRGRHPLVAPSQQVGPGEPANGTFCGSPLSHDSYCAVSPGFMKAEVMA